MFKIKQSFNTTLFRAILKITKRIRWYFQKKSLNISKLSSNSFQVLPEGNILLLVPHADDELIGCHNLIKSHLNRTYIFYFSFLGHNYNEDNRCIREEEFRNYMHHIGVKYIISSSKNCKEDLSKVILRIKPSTIFLPSYIDWHPEHRLVNNILANCLNINHINPLIGWYHVSLPIPTAYINYAIPMNSQEHNEKWEYLKKFYPSQQKMDTDRFKFFETLFVDQDKNILEVFMMLKPQYWYSVISKLSKQELNLNNTKFFLGDICKMYNSVQSFYNKL